MSEPRNAPSDDPARAESGRAGLGARLAKIGIVILGAAYLLNPSGGIFELLPDNLPIFGNLDEAGVTAAVLLALRSLGARWWRSRSARSPSEDPPKN